MFEHFLYYHKDAVTLFEGVRQRKRFVRANQGQTE
jgi:hypothetical protein